MELTEIQVFQRLAIALAVGLLIGIERGWQEREAANGSRVAGVRTFGLISMLGALFGLLALRFDPLVLTLGLVSFAALVVAGYVLSTWKQSTVGMTTEVAAFASFALGALAMTGYVSVAAVGAVVTVTLLGLKPVVHRWIQHLQPTELQASLKLLLISVVVLPVLPDRQFGPWQALNPYELWWMVVLIAGISYVGYVGIKVAGTRVGIGVTSVFGGLASSTAVTVNFARMARQNPPVARVLVAGVMVASATMFPRIALEVGVVNLGLLPQVAWPLGLMTVTGYLAAFWLWHSASLADSHEETPLRNPFEVIPALQFGALLALVMVLARALQAWLGDPGVYLVAAIAGFADVDAITLSLSRMARETLPSPVAAQAIVLAAIVNTLAKAALVAILGGTIVAARTTLAMTAVTLAGGMGLILGNWL